MSAPELTVIVPVRNEREFIADCLASILDDAPAGGIEVIVVDGLSDDGTRGEIERIARSRTEVRLIDNPSRFVPQAMNLGIAAARAPFIGRIDGHCRVEPGYFSACLERLRRGDADCVGGALLNVGRTDWGRAVAASQTSPVGVGSARFRTGRGGESLVDTLAFGVYRRDVFDRIGTFDEQFVRNQDDELNLRLVRAGGRILLLPRQRIRYFVRDSPAGLRRQYFQYGYWKWKVVRKHGRPASVRHLLPSAFLVTLLGLALAGVFWIPALWTAAGLLGVYLAVLAADSARLARRDRVAGRRVFVCLLSMHFGYGAGLIRGVLDGLLGRLGLRRARGATRLTR